MNNNVKCYSGFDKNEAAANIMEVQWCFIYYSILSNAFSNCRPTEKADPLSLLSIQ